MPTEQAVQFLAVAALALALVLVIVVPKLRQRGSEVGARGWSKPESVPALSAGAAQTPSPASLVCPACQRRYAAGLRFCPQDARQLVAVGESSFLDGDALTCPICRRAFAAGNHFCPFDAGPLAPAQSLAQTSASASRLALARPTLPSVPAAQFGGKICPICARHFGAEATFCGRDGSALVSVN